MPTGQNWINFIYVNLGFIAQVLAMYYFTSIAEIKKDWPKYRCNPMYMPLSDNIGEDFTYCVQNTQINMMGYLLEPLTFLLSNISSISGEFSESLNSVRDMFRVVREFLTNIVENIFGVFSNLVIEFQMITISLKDSVGKIIGILVSILYILDGSIKTMNSAWKGPAGQLVKAVGSACFHEHTEIKLKNGKFINIKDIPVGSIIEDGSEVIANMIILNKNNEKLYKIKGQTKDILVTGNHYILNENKFIKVKDHPNSILTEFKCDIYYCLITSSSKIKIDNQIFWDWEDDILNT
jgi:hypothetical protein